VDRRWMSTEVPGRRRTTTYARPSPTGRGTDFCAVPPDLFAAVGVRSQRSQLLVISRYRWRADNPHPPFVELPFDTWRNPLLVKENTDDIRDKLAAILVAFLVQLFASARDLKYVLVSTSISQPGCI
ncbi:hypothetical protein DXG01_014932, partial [Tephrocybe rancida]